MKTRRNFITKLGSLTAFFALLSTRNVAGTDQAAPAFNSEGMNGKFIHVVFFWLINDDQETRTKFLSELRKFIDNLDLIKTRHVGSPADTNREVIDNTWSYSLILSFDSKKEQELYQEHPLHQAFIEKASSLWEKVLVYDSLEI